MREKRSAGSLVRAAACLLFLLSAATASRAENGALRGPVRSVRTFTARFELKDGTWTETEPKAQTSAQYDRAGRVVEDSWYDANGQLQGRTTYRYDARGRKVEEATRRFDPPAVPTRERITYAYDTRGRLRKTTYYESDGSVAATQTFTYDRRGDKVAERWRTGDGKEERLPDTFRYDRRGRLVSFVTHDTRGVPETHVSRHDTAGRVMEAVTRWGEGGTSKDTFRYNGRGQRTEFRQGVAAGGTFAAKYTWAYDAQGRVIAEARYRPKELTRWLTAHYSYDSEGRVIDTTSYRPEGTVDHRTSCQYGPRGELTIETHYGAGNYLSGKTTYTYDDQGRVVEKSNYDGEALNNRSTFRYGEQGVLLEEVQYDAAGQVIGSETDTYDNEGRPAERRVLGREGALTGVYSYVYDGESVKETYAEPGKPKAEGAETRRYDAEGRLTEVERTAGDGTVESRTHRQYRPDGQVQEEEVEFGDGSLAERIAYTYDADNRLVKQSGYFGDGSLREETVYVYGRGGKVEETAEYFGALVESKRGYAYETDARGNVVRTVTGEITTREGKWYLRPVWASRAEITYF